MYIFICTYMNICTYESMWKYEKKQYLRNFIILRISYLPNVITAHEHLYPNRRMEHDDFVPRAMVRSAG